MLSKNPQEQTSDGMAHSQLKLRLPTGSAKPRKTEAWLPRINLPTGFSFSNRSLIQPPYTHIQYYGW